MIQFISRIMLRAAIWSLDRFYRVSRLGPPIPDDPVLVIANHPNSLMDALVVLKIAGRHVRPLARAPLFDRPIMGHVLRGLGALPVYRRQDLPAEMWRNEETFRSAVEALNEREAVLIFPEGLSHSEPRLAPMKTGAARIALRAEEQGGWRLGLQVVPVGLTYDRKHAFRGRVAVCVGQPLRVRDWKPRSADEEWAGVEDLTEAIGAALTGVTLNLPSDEDREIIEAAETLYATEKGEVTPRERQPLAPRLPRLRQFADALTWLRATDPDRYRRLALAVRNYRARVGRLGVGEGELPPGYRVVTVLRYALVEGLVLLIVLPLALVGTVAWYLPYQSPRLSLDWYRPVYEVVATVKLTTAFIAFPLTYGLWLALGWWTGGWIGLGALAVGLPFAGLAALHWRDRWGDAREDVRVFWRAIRRRSFREQLVARRRALVQEFDRIAREWRRERRHRLETR